MARQLLLIRAVPRGRGAAAAVIQGEDERDVVIHADGHPRLPKARFPSGSNEAFSTSAHGWVPSDLFPVTAPIGALPQPPERGAALPHPRPSEAPDAAARFPRPAAHGTARCHEDGTAGRGAGRGALSMAGRAGRHGVGFPRGAKRGKDGPRQRRVPARSRPARTSRRARAAPPPREQHSKPSCCVPASAAGTRTRTATGPAAAAAPRRAAIPSRPAPPPLIGRPAVHLLPARQSALGGPYAPPTSDLPVPQREEPDCSRLLLAFPLVIGQRGCLSGEERMPIGLK